MFIIFVGNCLMFHINYDFSVVFENKIILNNKLKFWCFRPNTISIVSLNETTYLSSFTSIGQSFRFPYSYNALT